MLLKQLVIFQVYLMLQAGNENNWKEEDLKDALYFEEFYMLQGLGKVGNHYFKYNQGVYGSPSPHRFRCQAESEGEGLERNAESVCFQTERRNGYGVDS